MTQLEKSVELIMQAIREAHKTPEELNAIHGVLLSANHALKTSLDNRDGIVYDSNEGEVNE